MLTNGNVKSRHSLGSREKGRKKKEEEEDEEEGDPCEVRRFFVWTLPVLVYCSVQTEQKKSEARSTCATEMGDQYWQKQAPVRQS